MIYNLKRRCNYKIKYKNDCLDAKVLSNNPYLSNKKYLQSKKEHICKFLTNIKKLKLSCFA